MKYFSKILFATFSFSVIAIACKKSLGSAPTPSSYYITYNVNGESKDFNNSIDVCAISDTNFYGQNIATCVITGASNVLPAEVLQISIFGDTSNLFSNTFIDTTMGSGYTLFCNHIVPGSIDYSTIPLTDGTVTSTNPFQITFNGSINGTVSGTFQGDLIDSTGTKLYTITNGKFNLPVKRS